MNRNKKSLTFIFMVFLMCLAIIIGLYEMIANDTANDTPPAPEPAVVVAMLNE